MAKKKQDIILVPDRHLTSQAGWGYFITMSQTARAKDWLSQAYNDLLFVELAIKNEFYSQACFISQQAAEKALKALGYHLGNDLVKGHSLKNLIQSFHINGELLDSAKILDQYYISTRYPDSLSAGAPHEYFVKKQATEALEMARKIIEKVDRSIK